MAIIRLSHCTCLHHSIYCYRLCSLGSVGNLSQSDGAYPLHRHNIGTALPIGESKDFWPQAPNFLMHVIALSFIAQPGVGDGDLAVPRDVLKHVEQHPVLAASLRIKLQYLISEIKMTCLCFAMAALCLVLSTSTASCVWLPVLQPSLVLVLKTSSTLKFLVLALCRGARKMILVCSSTTPLA